MVKRTLIETIRIDHSLDKRCPNCHIFLKEECEYDGKAWLRLRYHCPNEICNYVLTLVVDRPELLPEPVILDPHRPLTDPERLQKLQEMVEHMKGQISN